MDRALRVVSVLLLLGARSVHAAEDLAAAIRAELARHACLATLTATHEDPWRPAHLQPRHLEELFAARARRLAGGVPPEEYLGFLSWGREGRWAGHPEIQELYRKEIEFYRVAFATHRSSSGDRPYDLFEETQYNRRLDPILKRLLGERHAGPTVIRLVGLGRATSELRYVLTLVERALGEAGIAERVAALDLQVRLYDINAQVLGWAESARARAEESTGWARGRLHVAYTDMSMPTMQDGWESETTVLVVCRNGLRERLVRETPEFLRQVDRVLVPGGLFLTDTDVMFPLDTAFLLHALPFWWEKLGTQGWGEGENALYRRIAR